MVSYRVFWRILLSGGSKMYIGVNQDTRTVILKLDNDEWEKVVRDAAKEHLTIDYTIAAAVKLGFDKRIFKRE